MVMVGVMRMMMMVLKRRRRRGMRRGGDLLLSILQNQTTMVVAMTITISDHHHYYPPHHHCYYHRRPLVANHCNPTPPCVSLRHSDLVLDSLVPSPALALALVPVLSLVQALILVLYAALALVHVQPDHSPHHYILLSQWLILSLLCLNHSLDPSKHFHPPLTPLSHPQGGHYPHSTDPNLASAPPTIQSPPTALPLQCYPIMIPQFSTPHFLSLRLLW